MSHVQHIVLKQCIIDIIDRNPDLVSRLDEVCIELFCIRQLRADNSGDILLQDLIGRFLQIHINRQDNIIARLRFYTGSHLQCPPHVVDIEGLRTLISLQSRLQHALQSGLPDDIGRIIAVILFFEFLQLLCRDLSGITNQRCQILCIRIHPAVFL